MKEFEYFVEIVERLRKECPWDREQTHRSLKQHLLEEAYEAAEAISNDDMTELRAELGDLLLHIVLHSIIAAELHAFTLQDVLKGISEKMIRRHPHIYGDASITSAEEQINRWEKIKMEEGRLSVLDGIPLPLPALTKAIKLQRKAAKVGFDWSEKHDVWKKVEEELGELQQAESDDHSGRVQEEFGDLLFALVNYARFIGVDPEEALQGTNKKFFERFQYMERRFKESEKEISSATLEEMDVYWNEAKSLKK